MAEHTPLPWIMRDDPPQFEPIIYSGVEFVCRVYAGVDRDANAAFIVKAVNNHDALVAHLRRLAIHCCDDAALELIHRLTRPGTENAGDGQ
jgi:hypothetical protein